MTEAAAPAWKEAVMQGLLVLGLLAGWFVLSRWVLPAMGVPT